MRRVYTPPPGRVGPLWPIVGAAFLTLCVFLVLPLTQMVSSRAQRQLMLSKVDATQLEAPPPDNEPPPPEPPPEEQEPPPPPSLSDTPPPMNLSVDLDFAVGSGGALAGFGQFGSSGEGGNLMDAFDVADLEKRPEVISSVPPVYPESLRRARVEGTVTLVFVLDENGRVEDLRVEQSSRPEFEKPALDAVRRWKFRPGMKDGQAVRTYMRLPVRFRVSS
ncbi:MAG: energy transducer TonB [Limisphaerales bacterium]